MSGLGFPELAAGVNDGAGNVFDVGAFPVLHKPFAATGKNAATQLAVVA